MNKKDHFSNTDFSLEIVYNLKNSVDNGFIIFKDYKIPKDNMLDKLSNISDQGE